MTKKVFISVEKGYHADSPFCFRCGDCCSRVPVEVTQQEIDLVKSRLNQRERQLFLSSLTTNPLLANPIDKVMLPLIKGVAWIKMPCCFLEFEEHGNRKRAACKIYKFRPEICRIFHCGKEREDEPLQSRKYKYLLSENFRKFLEEHVRKDFGDKGWQEALQKIKQAEKETTKQ